MKLDSSLAYDARALRELRSLCKALVERHPHLIGVVLTEDGQCLNPELELLLLSFAPQIARIWEKLDDEFPEVTDRILEQLNPDALLSDPAVSIAQFVVDAQQSLSSQGYPIPRATSLEAQSSEGTSCYFRTCYPVTLWPIMLEEVALETSPRDRSVPHSVVAAIRLRFRCLGEFTFAKLAVETLRLYLHGDVAATFPLYELLFKHVCAVQFSPGDEDSSPPITLSAKTLQPVGFEREDALFSTDPNVAIGQRLLREYWSFPSKFLFCDVTGVRQVTRNGYGKHLEIRFFLDRIPPKDLVITPETFRLGCTPIVNLFDTWAKPFRLSHTTSEYQLLADHPAPHTIELRTVKSIRRIKRGTIGNVEDSQEIFPLHSLKHGCAQSSQWWFVDRRQIDESNSSNIGLFLSLVDLNLRPTDSTAETLAVQVTCTNGDLPRQMWPRGQEELFLIDGHAPVSRISCLLRPTAVVRPAVREGAQWRLIAQLVLNIMSLHDGGLEALQELLRLCALDDSETTRKQIAGITNLEMCSRYFTIPRVGSCPGTEVTIEVEEDHYERGQLFLFATVLDAVMSHSVGMNSYSQLRVISSHRKEVLHQWVPRTGMRPLL